MKTSISEFEERFRLLVDCVQDYAIYMIDENGKVISWNAGAERIKGYSAEEVLGRHFSIFYSAAEVERGKPFDQLRAATRAERIEDEGWRIRKDGSVFWANSVITAIRDTNKNVIGFSTIIRDFNERKRAEENLRDTKERLQLTLDSAIDAIVTMDGDGIIAEWNMEAERIFGWSCDEALGSKLVELIIPPKYRESHNRGVQRFLASGEGPLLGRRFEITGMRREGDEFPIELTVSAFKSAGGLMFSGSVRDISEYRRAEKKLHETQRELERVSRLNTVSEITASIAHEIRQPLASVRTNGGTCIHWLRTDPPNLEKAHSAAARIIENAGRASEIVDGIQTLFRKTEAELSPVNINDVINDVIVLLRGEMRYREIAITTELQADLSPVLGDRVQLQQVVLNLMMNGVEAMSNISDRPRTLLAKSKAESTGTLVVSVEDLGVGLDPAIADKIFEAFYSTKASGMGMGLAICRSIIESCGGELRASPRHPCGAIFQFTLPYNPNHSRTRDVNSPQT